MSIALSAAIRSRRAEESSGAGPAAFNRVCSLSCHPNRARAVATNSPYRSVSPIRSTRSRFCCASRRRALVDGDLVAVALRTVGGSDREQLGLMVVDEPGEHVVVVVELVERQVAPGLALFAQHAQQRDRAFDGIAQQGERHEVDAEHLGDDERKVAVEQTDPLEPFGRASPRRYDTSRWCMTSPPGKSRSGSGYTSARGKFRRSCCSSVVPPVRIT